MVQFFQYFKNINLKKLPLTKVNLCDLYLRQRIYQCPVDHVLTEHPVQ